MPVIKREQIEAREDVSPPDTSALAQNLRSRIARERVQMRGQNGDGSAVSGRSNRVLRRRDVDDRVEPVSVPVPDLEPDYPLAEPLEPEAPAEETAQDNSAPAAPDDSAPDLPSSADELQERLNAAAEQARSEGFKAGREAGYEQGYAEAHSELEEEFEARVADVGDVVHRLESLWNEFIDESQHHLVETTVDIAETLVDAPLPESIRRVSARAIAEAVEDLAGTPPLTINLHPVDYQHLQETGMLEQIDANHDDLRWNTRPELEPGDWSVESPVAMVRHFREELVRTLKTRLGALQDTEGQES